MGLFSYLSDWKASLYEKKIAEAQSLGHCPDCNGKGFMIPIVNEYSYPESFDCPGCLGTGSFTDWSTNSR